MIDVLVVGGIFREILEGDTTSRKRFGGSGLTGAVAAARLGASVALAGYVGDDDELAVRDELRLAGVDDTALVTVPGACGTFVFPPHGDRTRPWPMYRPAEAVPEAPPPHLPTAAIVVAFGIPDFDAIAEGWLAPLSADVTLIWDRQGWLSRARDSAAALALPPAKKIYLANEYEAAEDAQVATTDDAVAAQPPRGFDIAVIKRGIDGVIVVQRSVEGTRTTAVPAFPVAEASAIGSGDVFAGAFAARLARGDSPNEAARWGCAAAAIALESDTNLLDDAVDVAVSRLFSST